MATVEGPQKIYRPSLEVTAGALVKDHKEVARQAREDPAGFWAKRGEGFDWFRTWDTVVDDSKKPFYQWFMGGQPNIACNCLGRHVKSWRRNKLALI